MRRIPLVVLALAAAFAVAPAAAGERQSPPPLTVSNRGVSFDATLGSYYWCYRQDPYYTCQAVDTAEPPKSSKALPVRAGDEIVLRVHARARNVWVQYYDGTRYPNHPRPAGPKRRVWTLKVASGVVLGKNLLVNVVYANDRGDAQFGFRIRKAPIAPRRLG